MSKQELWQLYSDQGVTLTGQGAAKNDALNKGLLHGAAHVWMWHKGDTGIEVMLQKRAASKRTWPNHFDISAAGHIDLGEEPLAAAIREVKEEIGLDIESTDLLCVGVHRARLKAENGAIENEFQWLYLLQLGNKTAFSLQKSEVLSLEWKPLKTFRQELTAKSEQYVPYGKPYFDTIITAIEAAAKK